MRTVLLALVLLVPVLASAAERPLAGDALTLKDPANVKGRAVKFKAAKDAAIDPASGDDPTQVGATLEVEGANPGDGAAGPITLPAALWRGLGKPAGAKGYKFTDRLRADGVKTLTLKPGASGGTIALSGGGSDWSYAVTQAQGPIALRLTVGDDVYCARFTTFQRNQAGLVKAKGAPAPASCTPPAGPVCGDGVAEAPEECDDGGSAPGDGCSATCQLENTSALCAGVPSTPGTGIDSQLVTGGLTRPVFVTAPPLDPSRLFIVEQDGLVRIVKNGVLLPAPFLDLAAAVSCCGERGLLSLAFHPDYESNGVFFVNYTNNAGNTEVRRFTVSGDPDVASPTGTLVIAIDQDFANHNGGQLQFGPDGYLYVGMGDGGSGGDPNERAQDPTQLLGKMLRLDVSVSPYAIPPSNPFVGPGAPRDEIWALGLRNPWRFSFDRATGDLYIADVGQGAIEEVNVTPASSAGGENYGWDVFEGNACFEPTPPATSCPSPPTGFTFPVLTYDHTQGCSVTGGYVYRGCALPDLRGTYFYSDICAAFIRTFEYAGGLATNLQDRTATLDPPGPPSIGGVSSFGEDARGELYIVDYGNGSPGQGEVWRIVPGT
ncbi:MAG: PQQ-dependent sugar dehydrogenase [bacterium]|nr:PQQ-dependent sugar dehydrogenase [bacterium]